MGKYVIVVDGFGRNKVCGVELSPFSHFFPYKSIVIALISIVTTTTTTTTAKIRAPQDSSLQVSTYANRILQELFNLNATMSRFIAAIGGLGYATYSLLLSCSSNG